MVTLLVILYFGCVFAVFKFVKIKVTPVTVAVPVVLGTFLIGGIVVGWKMSAPISEQLFINRDVIGLTGSQFSKQQIAKIHFKEGQPVKKGDPLFEVDPTRNRFQVEQITAQLALANAQISEREAAAVAATSMTEGAKANEALQKAEFDRVSGVDKKGVGAISKLNVDLAGKTYESSRSATEQAISAEKAASFAVTNARESLREVEADLATAKLNLEQCVIRAPADGVVVNWQTVEGTMVHPVATSAVGTFMDMSETFIGAVFPQNLVKNIKSGDTVEFAFKTQPGEVVAGKVDGVMEYTGEGQLAPGSAIPIAADIHSEGELLVRIVLDDEDVAAGLPLGGAGAVAVYSEKGKPFHPISKIMIRLKSWMNYAPF